MFEPRTSASSWLTVAAYGRKAPLKTSDLALIAPEIFLPTGESGPTITTTPLDPLNLIGSSAASLGAIAFTASLVIKPGVLIKLSTSNSHCCLVREERGKL